MPVKATIAAWFPLRGYGFARPDQGQGTQDLFVHIKDSNVNFLHIGDRIECEIEAQSKGTRARQVKVLSFA
jgi:cold shock CspA family protein